MASSEPRFEVTVDHCRNPNNVANFSLIEFILEIRSFLEDDNGRLRWCARHEDNADEFIILPEFLVGSNRHRSLVARRLLQAGWLDRGSLIMILDQAFSDANLILEEEMRSRDNNEFHNVLRIIFRVKKILTREYEEGELAATVTELSMREEPKPVPATKESIEVLKKVKLFEGDGAECMICMEKLVSSKTENVTCMPSSHLFHGDCIVQWLKSNHTCPLCRFQMPTGIGKH